MDDQAKIATQRPKAVAMSFADTAGNGNGLTGLDVKDTERADHAADRPEEPQERRQGDDDAQIIEMTAKAGDKNPRLHFDKGLPFGAP